MATQSQPPFFPQNPVERDTIPKIFLSAIDRLARPDAMRYKQMETWMTLSHADVEQRVTRLAAALRQMGVGPGDRVALLSENRPEWAIVDYAVLGIGAADVPVYPTLPANQIAYILRDAGTRVIFASTPEQLAKIREIRDEVPGLERVIAFDDPGDRTGVSLLSDVYEEGRRAIEAGQVEDFREATKRVGRDDVATLIYTSGTTGNPKGVMLTHFNIASNVAAAEQHGVLRADPGDIALSFLPLSHIFERTADYFYWNKGVGIAYAESIEKVADNMGEVRPHLMVAVPRLYDKIYAKVMGATGIKKTLVMWAKGVGETIAEGRLAGREPGGMLAFQGRLADKLVFSKLRARTGGRIHTFISGGAPLSAEVGKFFFAAGLPVYEGYGLTETSPVISANRPGAVKLGSIGLPLPGVEVRIGETGEILARGPNIMKGYWNNPEATAEVTDADGWFHTGDIGEFDADGFLRITDRIKNLLVTAGGKNIAPQPIENQVAMSPYISQVVMLGDRRAFPSLLVVPDFENLAPWATAQGISTADPKTLAADPRVKEFLEREALARLEGFARYEMPKKISVVAEEFSIDSGMLTPSLKVRRKAVEERYRDVIEQMYTAGV